MTLAYFSMWPKQYCCPPIYSLICFHPLRSFLLLHPYLLNVSRLMLDRSVTSTIEYAGYLCNAIFPHFHAIVIILREETSQFLERAIFS
jgi:hypothetical protein